MLSNPKRPLAVVALLLASGFAQSSLLAQAAEPGVLAKVKAAAREAYGKQERPMVIFDVDGTLMDNRHRTMQILKEYGESELKRVRPEDYQRFKAITFEQIKYRLTDTLSAAGITDEAVVNNAAVFWSQRFFTDDYLRFDRPTPGSVQFVRELYSNGARIVYLTARDAPRQLLGTVKSLRDHGYPIGIQGTELVMRPTLDTQDAVFKRQVTNYLRHYGKIVATFDNEPGNANVYRRAFADAMTVLYDAPHAPDPPPLLPEVVSLATFEQP